MSALKEYRTFMRSKRKTTRVVILMLLLLIVVLVIDAPSIRSHFSESTWHLLVDVIATGVFGLLAMLFFIYERAFKIAGWVFVCTAIGTPLLYFFG